MIKQTIYDCQLWNVYPEISDVNIILSSDYNIVILNKVTYNEEEGKTAFPKDFSHHIFCDTTFSVVEYERRSWQLLTFFIESCRYISEKFHPATSVRHLNKKLNFVSADGVPKKSKTNYLSLIDLKRSPLLKMKSCEGLPGDRCDFIYL